MHEYGACIFCALQKCRTASVITQLHRVHVPAIAGGMAAVIEGSRHSIPVDCAHCDIPIDQCNYGGSHNRSRRLLWK